MITSAPTTPAPSQVAHGSSLLLYSVSWSEYTRLLKLFERRHLRITYDRGALEIMTIGSTHERYKGFLRRLFEVMVLALGVEVISFGAMTCRKRVVKRGLEPDECYYVGNESAIRGKMRIDLRRDPPPDLAMEMEVTRSALNRLKIYAKLKVPEVWRFDGSTLTSHHLAANGKYVVQPNSRAFPLLKATDLLTFLARMGQEPDGVILEDFRSWVVRNLAGQSRP